MKDIEILLENVPGSLALLGETLGKHGISLEGGGVFSYDRKAIAHYLVDQPELAKKVLEDMRFDVVKIHDVIILKLRQDVPGQLGLCCCKMALAGVNILVQYSDHAGQLILVVDDLAKGTAVSDEWMKTWWG